MVRWAKPKGAFERVGCNLRLFKRPLNMLSTLPADLAGFDLEMVSPVPPWMVMCIALFTSMHECGEHNRLL